MAMVFRAAMECYSVQRGDDDDGYQLQQEMMARPTYTSIMDAERCCEAEHEDLHVRVGDHQHATQTVNPV